MKMNVWHNLQVKKRKNENRMVRPPRYCKFMTKCFLFCRRFRWAAYTQFIHGFFGVLGNGTRRCIPSCAVNRIRQEFSSRGDHYTGFLPERRENLEESDCSLD